VRRLLERGLPRGNERVLDLGCGTGEWLLRALATRPHLHAEGVDTSEDALAQARRALQQRLDAMRMLESYRRQHEEQQHLIVTMRNALKQLQAKTEETELNIELLQMRRRRAQIQQAVYDTLSKNKQEHAQERVRRAEELGCRTGLERLDPIARCGRSSQRGARG